MAPITVVRLGPGEKAEEVDGDPIRFRRGHKDPYDGLKTGVYVLRTKNDWQKAWAGGEVPPNPELSETQMLMVVVAEKEDIQDIVVERAVETAELMTVWVRETKVGENCIVRREEGATRTAIDAVVAPRVDKPVKFYIGQTQAASCGAPPKADVKCRIATTHEWSARVRAKVGDKIVCELATTVEGRYPLVDQGMTLGEQPPGANAKLFFETSRRASFTLDTFGTYQLSGEAVDEGGRKGMGGALVEAAPKKSKDVLVQLLWSDLHKRGEQPLPKVTLRVTQVGPKAQRCSADVPVPGLCEAKTRGAYTHMKIPAQRRKLTLSALFGDDKPETGPQPCIHVWFDGNRTVEQCDQGARKADDPWDLGILDTATGLIAPPPPPPAPKPKPGEKPAAPASASASPPKPAPPSSGSASPPKAAPSK